MQDESQEVSVKMVDRLVAILQALSRVDVNGASVTEVALQAGLSKGTTHRLLTALVEVGFAFQDLNSKRYQLGSAAAAIGQSAGEHVFRTAAQPALTRLALATGDTALASIREGSAAVCVARVVGSYPIRTLTLDIGDRRPLGVGAGSLAIMSALDDQKVEEALLRNRRWLQDYQHFAKDEIIRSIATTRQQGFARNDGRIVAGMSAVAVAVIGRDKRVLGALSIAAIKERMDRKRVPELVALLKEECAALSEALAPNSLAGAA
jgi:DNA-binding IclR family transcriptional regulator